jgi:U3 small nucleolar RNA-associated protein 3
MRELAQELAGAPEEVTADIPGMDTAAAVAARQRLEARSAAEEELMLRVPLSKAEAKKLKAQRRCGLTRAHGGWGCSATYSCLCCVCHMS